MPAALLALPPNRAAGCRRRSGGWQVAGLVGKSRVLSLVLGKLEVVKKHLGLVGPIRAWFLASRFLRGLVVLRWFSGWVRHPPGNLFKGLVPAKMS